MPVAKQFKPTPVAAAAANVMALPTAKQSAAAARPEPASPDGEEPAATTQGDAELREFMRAKVRRKKSLYDGPTAFKVLVGSRMRQVREAAGVTLTDAAQALGYTQPVHLSTMETGQRPVTLRVLVQYAASFDTTVDYLLGLCSAQERDPAVVVQQRVAATIAEDLRQVLALVTGVSIDLARDVQPTTAKALRLANAAIEASRVLTALRTANPAFDDEVRGGAKLVTSLDGAAELAIDLLGSVRALERRAKGGMLGAALAPALADEGRSVEELADMLVRPRRNTSRLALAALAATAEAGDEGDADDSAS